MRQTAFLILLSRACAKLYAYEIHPRKTSGTGGDLSQLRYKCDQYAPREEHAYPLPSVQCKLTSSYTWFVLMQCI
jgi:hypothetical protein